ncbi:MAG: hypothetical protein FWH19_01765 [Treponema sp.]|nr:hypothetical protein [Treponema sp.]
MKRVFFALIIFLVASTVMYAQQYAQQRGPAPTRQEMQTYLGEVRNNSSRFDSMLSGIIQRNDARSGEYAFMRLRTQIDSLAGRIQVEGDKITAVHDGGNFVSEAIIERLDRLITMHRERQQELERLLSN